VISRSLAILRLREALRLHAGWFVLLAAVMLTWVGIMAIGTAEPYYAQTQLRWLFISILVAGVCVVPHPRVVGQASYVILAVGIALLVFLLLPGVPNWLVPPRNGAQSWINLGFASLQPSEMVKIFFVLAVAWYLRYTDSYRTLLGVLLPFVGMCVPVGLILKQPDLGTALLFAPTLFLMLVAAGARLRHLGLLGGLAAGAVLLNVIIVLALPPSMQVLRPHQQERIRSMVSQVQGDQRYIRDIGYQQYKAITLVGAGGATGYGQRSSVIVEFNRLPEDHNDMIFAVIVNRWGFFGGLVVLGLYSLMVLSLLVIAARSKDPFARLSCVGFAGLILTQAVINMGMTVGLLPITGIPLPFVSYGGSSLASMFAMVGLAFNFAWRRPAMLARPSFEYDKGEAIFQ